MNLTNYMEEWEYGFPLITSLSLGMSMLVCGYGLTRLKRIQKLTLYGRYPGIKRNGKNGLGSFATAHSIAKIKWWKWSWMRHHYDDEHITRVKWWKRLMKGRLRGHS